jgi:hypothetical protein
VWVGVLYLCGVGELESTVSKEYINYEKNSRNITDFYRTLTYIYYYYFIGYGNYLNLYLIYQWKSSYDITLNNYSAEAYCCMCFLFLMEAHKKMRT